MLRFKFGLFVACVLASGLTSQGQTTFSQFGQSHRTYRPNLYRNVPPGYLRSAYGWDASPATSSYYRSVLADLNTSGSTTAQSTYYDRVYSGAGLDAARDLYPSSQSGLSSSRRSVQPSVRYIYPGNFDPFTRRNRSTSNLLPP